MFDHISRPLFILEMANNHMGDIAHAKRLVREFHDAVAPYRDSFDFAFKLQMRDPSIIHPTYADRMDLKFIKRFTETRIDRSQYEEILAAIQEYDFLPICTPFDEPSVEVVAEMGFPVLKIASCSFGDWPLLEAAVKTGLPMILSTGGAPLNCIDQVVAFLKHRDQDFALMHCVTSYPTPCENQQLNQINLLQERYPGVSIGSSTHEPPAEATVVPLAVAKGCMLFEKHVGIQTDTYSLNAYSATPAQVGAWLASAHAAFTACGVIDQRMDFSREAEEALQGLMRGVFLKRPLKKGARLSGDDLFLAMPSQPGQLLARDLSKYTDYDVKNDLDTNAPVMFSDVEVQHHRDKVAHIIHQVIGILKSSHIAIPRNAECSISAHYGLDRFPECGVVALNILNREYCKKLLIMLPAQQHPVHYHKEKEETFHILHGDLEVEFTGQPPQQLHAGDLLTVNRQAPHSFRTEKGVVIEEISTTHIVGDSYYDDPVIMNNPNRKIELTIWPDFYESVGSIS